MIDWTGLGAGSLWILALAIALAAVSAGGWQASREGVKLGAVLGRKTYQFSLNLAGVLFALGLGLSAGRGWERVLWAVLALFYLIQLWMLLRRPGKRVQDRTVRDQG